MHPYSYANFLLKRLQPISNRIVRIRRVAIVLEQRLALIRNITHAPNRDTHTSRNVIASLDDLPVLLRIASFNIELSNGDFRRSAG